jgi:rhodanese-related sulfurtransferase
MLQHELLKNHGGHLVKSFIEAILIAFIASILGLGLNGLRTSFTNSGLPLDTPWPDNRKIAKLDIPPSYQAGDSLLSVEEAYSLFLSGDVIFIDAREPFEFEEGHIKDAISFPFDHWDDYWEGVKARLIPKNKIVVYCGGLDCELSVFSARELKAQGFPNSYIFFGGWLSWNEAGLPIEGSKSNE